MGLAMSEDGTYNVDSIRAKESIVSFPAYSRLDLPFRVLVQ